MSQKKNHVQLNKKKTKQLSHPQPKKKKKKKKDNQIGRAHV